MSKLLFVYNPSSGKGLVKHCLHDILDAFTRAGFDVTAHPTMGRLDARDYIARHAAECDRIIVSGGDGTLSEAVSALMTLDADKRPPIGYIPTGTTNDFASTLGIPKNIAEAADTAAGDTYVKCDVGIFNDKYFNYVAAFGAFTDVSYDTPQGVKNIMGHSAYIWEGLRRLTSLPSYNVKIRCGGEEIEENIALCLIMNTSAVGGFTLPIPDISINDGLFELLYIKHPDNIINIQPAIDGIIKGKPRGEGYAVMRADKIEFASEVPIKWTLDGEFGGETENVKIEVAKEAVTYLAPPSA